MLQELSQECRQVSMKLHFYGRARQTAVDHAFAVETDQEKFCSVMWRGRQFSNRGSSAPGMAAVSFGCESVSHDFEHGVGRQRSPAGRNVLFRGNLVRKVNGKPDFTRPVVSLVEGQPVSEIASYIAVGMARGAR